MATLGTPRRFYLSKRTEARLLCHDSERIWQAKQEAQPGTPLPEEFPHAAQLAELGYETREDLDGADEDELVRLGVRARDASEILAALAAL